MATMADLFGGGSDNAPFYPLKNSGDSIVGVIVGEPKWDVPVYDFNTKKPKYFVEIQPGTWKVLPDGQFDKELNHRPVHKIVVTLRDESGKEWRIDFNTKQERESLKAAMLATGLNLEDGVTIGKKVTDRQGNIKTVAVRLAAADE